MRKLLFTLGLATLAIPQSVFAFNFRLQPRVETGVLYYKFDQRALAEFSMDALGSPQGAITNVISDLKLSYVLPSVSVGLTAFFDRLFLDVTVQRAFNGEDKGQFNSYTLLQEEALPFIPAGTLAQTDISIDSDLERTETTISLGYGVTDHFVLYAGYKRAESNFDQKLTGALQLSRASDLTPIPALTGPFTGSLDFEFTYDGPFGGAAYTWEIGQGRFKGTLSGNVGVALLDGQTNNKFKDFILTNQFGVSTPIDLNEIDQRPVGLSDLKGDAFGLSLGLAWMGFTPLDGLIYSLSITGYRYDFESDETQDFTEVLARVSVGLAYAFDF